MSLSEERRAYVCCVLEREGGGRGHRLLYTPDEQQTWAHCPSNLRTRADHGYSGFAGSRGLVEISAETLLAMGFWEMRAFLAVFLALSGMEVLLFGLGCPRLREVVALREARRHLWLGPGRPQALVPTLLLTYCVTLISNLASLSLSFLLCKLRPVPTHWVL